MPRAGQEDSRTSSLGQQSVSIKLKGSMSGLYRSLPDPYLTYIYVFGERQRYPLPHLTALSSIPNIKRESVKSNTRFQNLLVRIDTPQLRRSYHIILPIMQQEQDNPPDHSACSEFAEFAATKASELYSEIRTRYPNVAQPSPTELKSLKESLQPYLKTRLEASWAANARGTVELESDRTDLIARPDFVQVTVLYWIRRFEPRYEPGRRLNHQQTDVTGVTFVTHAQSVFDPQTRVWSGIPLPLTLYHPVSPAPST